jgi:hypothetical protein
VALNRKSAIVCILSQGCRGLCSAEKTGFRECQFRSTWGGFSPDSSPVGPILSVANPFVRFVRRASFLSFVIVIGVSFDIPKRSTDRPSDLTIVSDLDRSGLCPSLRREGTELRAEVRSFRNPGSFKESIAARRVWPWKGSSIDSRQSTLFSCGLSSEPSHSERQWSKPGSRMVGPESTGNDMRVIRLIFNSASMTFEGNLHLSEANSLRQAAESTGCRSTGRFGS